MTSARIVVGVDSSRAARSALFWAADECRLRACSLLIVDATEAGPLAVDDTAPRAPDRSADQLLSEYAMLASARQPTVAVSTLLTRAQPDEALVRLSAAAVMLLLPCTQRGSMAPLARRVAAHTHCPVVLVPVRPTSIGRTARILVATTTGPSGRRARAFAREEALIRSAALQVVVGPDAVSTVLRQSGRDELAVIGTRQADEYWSAGTDPAVSTLTRWPSCPLVLVTEAADISPGGQVRHRSAV